MTSWVTWPPDWVQGYNFVIVVQGLPGRVTWPADGCVACIIECKSLTCRLGSGTQPFHSSVLNPGSENRNLGNYFLSYFYKRTRWTYVFGDAEHGEQVYFAQMVKLEVTICSSTVWSIIIGTSYTETPSFRTIHIPDSGHFVRLIPAPKFTCSGIFLVRNLHVPKNYCPVNSCIYDKFWLREIFINSVIFHHSTHDQMVLRSW